MSTRYFALIFGIFLLLSGISGFIPTFVGPPTGSALPLALDAGYGSLLGILPTNVLFNILRLTLGVLGIAAYGSATTARTYAAGIAISYLLFAVMGLIPGLNTVFGLMPIYGNNVWFHGLTGLLATYFGFKQPDDQTMAGDVQKQYPGSAEQS